MTSRTTGTRARPACTPAIRPTSSRRQCHGALPTWIAVAARRCRSGSEQLLHVDHIWSFDQRFSKSFIWAISAVWAASIFLAKATEPRSCRRPVRSWPPRWRPRGGHHHGAEHLVPVGAVGPAEIPPVVGVHHAGHLIGASAGYVPVVHVVRRGGIARGAGGWVIGFLGTERLTQRSESTERDLLERAKPLPAVQLWHDIVTDQQLFSPSAVPEPLDCHTDIESDTQPSSPAWPSDVPRQGLWPAAKSP